MGRKETGKKEEKRKKRDRLYTKTDPTIGVYRLGGIKSRVNVKEGQMAKTKYNGKRAEIQRQRK